MFGLRTGEEGEDAAVEVVDRHREEDEGADGPAVALEGGGAALHRGLI